MIFKKTAHKNAHEKIKRDLLLTCNTTAVYGGNCAKQCKSETDYFSGWWDIRYTCKLTTILQKLDAGATAFKLKSSNKEPIKNLCHEITKASTSTQTPGCW